MEFFPFLKDTAGLGRTRRFPINLLMQSSQQLLQQERSRYFPASEFALTWIPPESDLDHIFITGCGGGGGGGNGFSGVGAYTGGGGGGSGGGNRCFLSINGALPVFVQVGQGGISQQIGNDTLVWQDGVMTLRFEGGHGGMGKNEGDGGSSERPQNQGRNGQSGQDIGPSLPPNLPGGMGGTSPFVFPGQETAGGGGNGGLASAGNTQGHKGGDGFVIIEW